MPSLTLSLVLTGALVSGDAPAADSIHPRRLLVEVEANATLEELEAPRRLAAARVLFDLPQIGWQVIEIPEGRLEAARSIYAESSGVARVEYDRRYELSYTPNDPYWPGMWHMTQIEADDAWDTHLGDPSVVVGILDTGLEVGHPDLAANIWTNPGEIAGNGVDDDLNGYVDDVYGYDFAYVDSDPDDQHGHGTACAGVVAAVQDNWLGVTGVAPQCRVAGIKTAIDSGYFYDSAVVPAFLYSADMGFDVISMSFYCDEVTPAQRDAIAYCWSKGVLPVASAGNDDSVIPFYPASYAEVLSVGASDESDQRLWFSNYGSVVSVCAPGISISTTTVGGGYTTGFAGTSGSGPHVAGLAALLCAADPSATNAEVRAAIEDTAIPNASSWSAYGRIDCKAALDRLLGVTSGPVTPRLVYVSPCGGGLRYLPQGLAADPPSVVLHGVGFEGPGTLSVLRDGVPLPVISRERNRIELGLFGNTAATIDTTVNGQGLPSLEWEAGMGFLYAPSDAGTDDWGVVTGGFLELYRDDGAELTCTRRSDGTIETELVIRDLSVEPIQRMRLELTRAWEDCAGADERIEIYDWSTASYPYGSWETIQDQPISGSAMNTLVIDLPANPARYVDDVGSVYLRLTATSSGPAGRLRADSLRLRVF